MAIPPDRRGVRVLPFHEPSRIRNIWGQETYSHPYVVVDNFMCWQSFVGGRA